MKNLEHKQIQSPAEHCEHWLVVQCCLLKDGIRTMKIQVMKSPWVPAPWGEHDKHRG